MSHKSPSTSLPLHARPAASSCDVVCCADHRHHRRDAAPRDDSSPSPELREPDSGRPRSLVSRLDPRGWLRTILRLDDSPHSIALGTAIGMFIGLTPTVGIQMMIVIAVAFLTSRFFRFNRMAALITVYVSNPFTMIPIYWFNYRVGALCLHETVSREEFARLFTYHSFAEWWTCVEEICRTVGVPLLLGSLAVATVGGLLSYPIMLRLATRVHARRAQSH